jgi:RNA polymerase sigma-70 factor (ECF subfamily)
MFNEALANKLREGEVTERFLEAPCEESFADLFEIFTPQLVAFFTGRDCRVLAEDLAQDVMLTVYRKAEQVRDRSLFRAWMFKIARNTLCRQYGRRAREVETVDLSDVPDGLVAASQQPAGTPAFEFLNWMAFLDSQEREALKLRFIEQWEYHEIADAQSIPIGTVQWRVHNAKKKLAPLLRKTDKLTRQAA